MKKWYNFNMLVKRVRCVDNLGYKRWGYLLGFEEGNNKGIILLPAKDKYESNCFTMAYKDGKVWAYGDNTDFINMPDDIELSLEGIMK